MATLTILKLIEQYGDTRDVSDSCFGMKKISLQYFERFLERPATLKDFEESILSKWITWLKSSRSTWTDRKLSARSVKNYRCEMITLWRFAVEMEHIKTPPQHFKIKKVKVPPPNPSAWDAGQLRELLAAIGKTDGVVGNGLPRRMYFATLMRVAYQTGLRRGDLLAVSMEDVDQATGTVSVVMNKTNQVHVCRINAEALADLVDLHETLKMLGDPNAETPLAWPGHLHNFYYWLRKICAAADVPYGALQHMRRTSATLTEIAAPGTASRLLGHMTPGLANTYYIDRSKLPTIAPPSVI